MNDQIERVSEVSPASFNVHQVCALTRGQQRIIELLQSSLKSGTPVTRNDIIQAWIDIQCKNGMRKTQVLETYWSTTERAMARRWAWAMTEAKVDGYIEKISGMQWFKNNLGSCIIKGRILAIPVIEISE